MRTRLVLVLALLALAGSAWFFVPRPARSEDPPAFPVVKTDEEWRRLLTPEQYRVLRGAGTELACSGAYDKHHEPGTYHCAGCGNLLFRSEEKFDSGTGWPSYFQPAGPGSVGTRVDSSHMMVRTEVHCARCGGHLGHVFEDGPAPTGLRYCINSVALTFRPAGAGPTAEPAPADPPGTESPSAPQGPPIKE